MVQIGIVWVLGPIVSRVSKWMTSIRDDEDEDDATLPACHQVGWNEAGVRRLIMTHIIANRIQFSLVPVSAS